RKLYGERAELRLVLRGEHLDADAHLRFQRQRHQHLELLARQSRRHRRGAGALSMADHSRPARLQPVEPLERQPACGGVERVQAGAVLTMRRPLDVALSELRRFAGNRKGVAAVEFAIILPFMLVFYLGSIEAGNGLAVQFKAALASRTVADLASQY